MAKNDEYFDNPRPDIQSLVSEEAKVILDVGCGAGAMGAALKERNDAEVWGIEIIANIAEKAVPRLDKVLSMPVEQAVNELPDDYFDSIVFADVLEHLYDPYSLLKNIKGKLKQNGEVIASIPNIRFWAAIVQILEGKFPYSESGIFDFTHLRFFTRVGIADMFVGAGYTISNMYSTTLNDIKAPQEVIDVLAKQGYNVSTLGEESSHFQYMLKAVKSSEEQSVKDIISQKVLAAQQHINRKEFQPALEHIEAVIALWKEHKPGDIGIELNKIVHLAGQISGVMGNNAKAEEFYLYELELNPASAEAYIALGDTYLLLDDKDKARTMFEKALELNGSNKDVIERLNNLDN